MNKCVIRIDTNVPCKKTANLREIPWKRRENYNVKSSKIYLYRSLSLSLRNNLKERKEKEKKNINVSNGETRWHSVLMCIRKKTKFKLYASLEKNNLNK